MPRILDHPLLSARMFFPRREPLANPFWVIAEECRLGCARFTPHPEALTLLHFHGNGEVVADYLPAFADLLCDLGVNAVFAEYRGYGVSTGRPTLGTLLEDSHRIFDALGLPANRVIAFGRSLGSYAAIELAQRLPLAGLILESGIADPLERILMRITPDELGVPGGALAAAVTELVDHERKLAAYHGPLLVLHAVRDEHVNATHAVRLASWARGDDRELVLLPHGGHNSILAENHAAYVAALRGFLARIPR